MDLNKLAREQQEFRSHIIGFIVSFMLTLLSYISVRYTLFPQEYVIGVIVVCVILQLWVQLSFFLHLGNDPALYWNRLAFFFMILVLVIVVGGSLWIMNNLNSNVMPQM